MNVSLPTDLESEKLSELLNLATGYQKAKVLFTFTELGNPGIFQVIKVYIVRRFEKSLSL
jgi:hypothetical protein